MENEEPLSGGRITPGVVKAGDTVRRPTTPASPFVAQLLGHLQRQGFTGAPRHLGIDEAGRDVLSYVPGRVPARFQRWGDVQVAAAGALLRALHDATRGSRLAGQHPVICHHDPGPNNAVFQKEVPVALIDWDTAAPGEPLEDLGYMSWTWCVSSRADAPSAAAQALQVRVLADAYGLGAEDRARLVDAMLERQERNARWWSSQMTRPGPRLAEPHEIDERIRWSEREYAYTAAHRTDFTAAL